MHSKEAKVTYASEYYVYVPSAAALKIYLYPIVVGRFYYEPGYYLRRNSYDSILVMYVNSGKCRVGINGQLQTAERGQVVLLDCYQPHEYGNAGNGLLDITWIHFDGPLAMEYYRLITSAFGNILTPANSYPVVHTMEKIIDLFRSSSPIRESAVSIYITQVLTELLTITSGTNSPSSHARIVENSVAFINEHFSEPLTLDMIAENSNLSPYHFTRIFTAETGFTPHQYLIATRLNSAKFLLRTPGTSIKEIAFSSGFNSESSFCSTFRKWEGVTPTEYRTRALASSGPESV